MVPTFSVTDQLVNTKLFMLSPTVGVRSSFVPPVLSDPARPDNHFDAYDYDRQKKKESAALASTLINTTEVNKAPTLDTVTASSVMTNNVPTEASHQNTDHMADVHPKMISSTTTMMIVIIALLPHQTIHPAHITWTFPPTMTALHQAS